MTRELFPTDNFYAQQASQVRFGLGSSETVSRLTVHWPSGLVQVLDNIPANRHIRITEGSDDLTVLTEAGEFQP